MDCTCCSLWSCSNKSPLELLSCLLDLYPQETTGNPCNVDLSPWKEVGGALVVIRLPPIFAAKLTLWEWSLPCIFQCHVWDKEWGDGPNTQNLTDGSLKVWQV